MSLFRRASIAALLALATPAQATWREASSTHFLIYSEDGAGRLEDFATELERYDAAMRFMRGIPPEDPGKANRVTVYVVADGAELRRLLKAPSNSIVGGIYRGMAGASFAIIPGSFDGDSSWAQTALLHEYAHHFMLGNVAAAWPKWFVEGFAEFNDTATFKADGSVALGKPPLFRAGGLVSLKPTPIEKLLAPDKEVKPDQKVDPEEVEAFYGRAWLLTHYLTLDEGRQNQLVQYLSAINRGTPNLEAAREAFGDLDKLNGALNDYLARRIYFFTIPAKAINPGPIEVHDLGPAEQALMDVRIRSRIGVNKTTAPEVLELARAGVAPFPHDAFAQSVLAEAEFDVGHLDEAAAAADRAIAADPKSMDGLLYRARVLAERAEAKKTDAAAWKAVRVAYASANHVDPNDPRPLMGFYEAFLSEGSIPTKPAAAGLLRALELAPQDNRLRMMVASQYLREDRLAEARHTLAPVAYSPHASEASKKALAMIEEIDAKQKAATANAGATPH